MPSITLVNGAANLADRSIEGLLDKKSGDAYVAEARVAAQALKRARSGERTKRTLLVLDPHGGACGHHSLGLAPTGIQGNLV